MVLGPEERERERTPRPLKTRQREGLTEDVQALGLLLYVDLIHLHFFGFMLIKKESLNLDREAGVVYSFYFSGTSI